MKVLIITTLYPPHITGGAEITIHTIAEGLVKDGVEVAVLATKGEPGLTVETINGVRVWRAGLKNVYWHHSRHGQPPHRKLLWHLIDIFNPFMPQYAETVFTAERPDVIQMHVITGWTSALTRWATRKAVPTIQVLHGYYLLCFNGNVFSRGRPCRLQCMKCRLARAPHRIYTNKLSAVVGCSRAVLAKHTQFGYFSGIKLHNVIYNARDPKMLGSRAPAICGGAGSADFEAPDRDGNPPAGVNNVVKFGFMGALSATKGLELLLKTFIEVAPAHAELQIAGTGADDYVRSLQTTFKHERVVFVGKSDPASFFGNIDVAVVPSLWDDPLPGVTFEALAFGRPVIGATRGGIQEMIQVGNNGLIFDPDRPAELADAIVRLATDAELRDRLSRNASASVKQFFSVPRISREYQMLYYKLLKMDYEHQPEIEPV